MSTLSRVSCVRDSRKPNPIQINENTILEVLRQFPCEKMSSAGRQGAKMPLRVAKGYSFVRALAEQMEGS